MASMRNFPGRRPVGFAVSKRRLPERNNPNQLACCSEQLLFHTSLHLALELLPRSSQSLHLHFVQSSQYVSKRDIAPHGSVKTLAYTESLEAKELSFIRSEFLGHHW